LIAVLADTHMPKGGRALPEGCVELLREADATLHAGDFFAVETLREIAALSGGPVHAVYGNVDRPDQRVDDGPLPPQQHGVLHVHRLCPLPLLAPVCAAAPAERAACPWPW